VECFKETVCHLYCLPLDSFLYLICYKSQQISADVIINHLLYMDDIKLYAWNDSELQSLCSVVYTYANDICMSFGLDKCKCVTVLRGKLKNSDNIKLPSSEVIHQVETIVIWIF